MADGCGEGASAQKNQNWGYYEPIYLVAKITMTTTRVSESARLSTQQIIVLKKTAGQQPGSGHCV